MPGPESHRHSDALEGSPHRHGHSHTAATPHPAQRAPWSILRMTLAARLGAAIAVSAGLWLIVLMAMR